MEKCTIETQNKICHSHDAVVTGLIINIVIVHHFSFEKLICEIHQILRDFSRLNSKFLACVHHEPFFVFATRPIR